MALKLYVRGASADVAVPDLGITVAQGPGWTQLNYSSPENAEGDSGQFTARELRDSGDLYSLVSASTLEWSKDGSGVEDAADYVADYMITEDFTDDTFDLSDGGFVFPNSDTLPASGIEGQTYWDTDDDTLYVWNGTEWDTVGGDPEDHGNLIGLGDDDHDQYMLLDGDLIRNQITGGIDLSTASGLIVPQGTGTSGQTPTEGNLFWDSDDDALYMYDGVEWITIATSSGINTDHGALTGLNDDDHVHYLNETRHDALPADNPHSVTFTQAVTADGGTDISAAEAETLTDGSNADALHAHDTSHTHAHSEITSVGTDDHHAKSHIHDGIDGSGTVEHHDLTGLSDDDHDQYVLIDGDLTRNQFTDGGLDLASASGLIVPTGTDRTGLAEVEGNVMWDTDDDQPWFFDGAIWRSVPMLLSGVLDHGSLEGLDDDDHPQYTEWEEDETISGVWTFDPADTDPNFILDPRASAPTNNLVDGAVTVVGGILYAYDATRSKWLSVDRTTYFGGRNGNANNIYLRVADGVATSATGIRILRDGTIVGLFAQTEGAESWTFEVRDSTGSVLTSLVISAADGDQDSTINVNVSAGDEIRLYVNGTGILRPVAGFEVAWRI
jgi:hypothetical protein